MLCAHALVVVTRLESVPASEDSVPVLDLFLLLG